MLCAPVQLGLIVTIGKSIYDWFNGINPMKSAAVGISISFMFWILCAANMELIAWVFLLIPVVFISFVIALIFFDQLLFVHKAEYGKKKEAPAGCPTIDEETSEETTSGESSYEESSSEEIVSSEPSSIEPTSQAPTEAEKKCCPPKTCPT